MTDIREEVRQEAAHVRETRAAYQAAIEKRDRKILAAIDYGIKIADVIKDAGFTQQSGRNRLQQIRERLGRREAKE